MFQYAAGRSLSAKLNVNLKIDTHAYTKHNVRRYGLGAFNVVATIATHSEIRKMLGLKFNPVHVVLRKVQYGEKLIGTHYRENHFHFDPGFGQLADNTYIDGYWQSHKYFSAIERIIRHEFDLKKALDRDIDAIKRRIVATESVSIHFRCKDYLSEDGTTPIHGTCDREYYRKSFAFINENTTIPHYFIFSDDPQWVRRNFPVSDKFTIIGETKPNKEYEDLILMSLCKHNIIANSTFSWWAAWLNPNDRKIVIAPQKWLNKNIDESDIIPDNWTRM